MDPEGDKGTRLPVARESVTSGDTFDLEPSAQLNVASLQLAREIVAPLVRQLMATHFPRLVGRITPAIGCGRGSLSRDVTLLIERARRMAVVVVGLELRRHVRGVRNWRHRRQYSRERAARTFGLLPERSVPDDAVR
jgi:hypothetical protein